MDERENGGREGGEKGRERERKRKFVFSTQGEDYNEAPAHSHTMSGNRPRGILGIWRKDVLEVFG